MDKLKMQTANLADEKFKKLLELFPNIATETIDSDGNLVRSIDKDILTQEINYNVVEGRQERYQFTWPGKKKTIALANTPINKTLRLNKEKSIGKDGAQGKIDSENIYIEGDNLETLKLLRETYLNAIDVIYIDPPYNTGDDYIYCDDFSIPEEEYKNISGEFNNDRLRLVKNLDSNGRFHTDWLNFMYPRLLIAKDMLSNDGVLFLSIDYHENANARKILDELLGADAFIGEIYWESKTKSQNTKTAYNKLQPKAEMILVYSKDSKRRFNLAVLGEKEYPFDDGNGPYREYALEFMNAEGIRGRESMIFPITVEDVTINPPKGKQWQIGQELVEMYKDNNDLFIRDGKVFVKMRPGQERSNITEPFWGFIDKTIGTAESAKKELSSILPNHGFETVKPVELIKKLIFHASNTESIILDFFSGSATTAEAVLKLNQEDNGKRKYIVVQLPVPYAEGSLGYKAGYKTLCDLGQKRIITAMSNINTSTVDFDKGFRVLYLDSSNMKDIYYEPTRYKQLELDLFEDNIKPDRNNYDLLIQVMLELGIELSTSINMILYNQKEIHTVGDNYLVSYLDTRTLTEDFVIYLARLKPVYVVFNNQSIDSDSLLSNIEQIFNTYSPDTKRMVI